MIDDHLQYIKLTRLKVERLNIALEIQLLECYVVVFSKLK